MAIMAVIHKIDGERVADDLNAMLEKLDGEVVLDFSGVRRVSPAGLRGLEKLAAQAEENSVKVELRGVAVDIYKVLKLARLSGRFGFGS